jgi:hypothetical protein
MAGQGTMIRAASGAGRMNCLELSAFPVHYVMRSGWTPEDRFLILDGGPHGTNHHHEDALNFELFAYGEHLIIDPGLYRYNYDSPWRQFMISSLAHNTLAVDGQGQCRRQKRATWVAKGPMPNVWRTGDDLTYFRGSYTYGYGDGGRVPVEHTRSVFFIEGRFWVIVDRARPRDTAEHLYESLFMLNAPDAAVTEDGGRILTRRAGPNLLIAAAPVPGQTAQVVKGQTEPVRRGWKPGGETVVPNPTAVFAQRKAGPATFALALYPLPGARWRRATARRTYVSSSSRCSGARTPWQCASPCRTEAAACSWTRSARVMRAARYFSKAANRFARRPLPYCGLDPCEDGAVAAAMLPMTPLPRRSSISRQLRLL